MKKIITSFLVFALCFRSAQLLYAQGTTWTGAVATGVCECSAGILYVKADATGANDGSVLRVQKRN